MLQPVQRNDLALLKMNTSSTWGPTSQKRGFYVDPDFEINWDELENRQFSLIGYGQKDENDSAKSFQDAYYTNMLPHDVDQVQFLGNDSCYEKLQQYHKNLTEENTQAFLCGIMTVGDLCTGDYGAPVLLKEGDNSMNGLLGLFSWKPRQAKCNLQNSSTLLLFTNISHYSDWITDMALLLDPNTRMAPPPPLLPLPTSQNLPPPDAPISTVQPHTSTSGNFPLWTLGIFATVLLAGLLIFVVVMRRRGHIRRGKNSGRYQIEDEEHYLSDTYTSILIPSLNKSETKDTYISAFGGGSKNSKQEDGGGYSFPLTPQEDIMCVDLNQISYPVNTRLLLNSLHRKALKGQNPKLYRNIPFNQKLVMKNHPQVDAILSVQDGHEVTRYEGCYIAPEVQEKIGESQQQLLLNLRLLSELNLKSLVPKAHIHRKHSDMQRSFLKRKGMSQTSGGSSSSQSQKFQQSEGKQYLDASLMLFPMAAESVLDELDSEVVDAVTTSKTEQLLTQMKAQLQSCGMYIDVPSEIELGRRLGGGNFGTVYEGVWHKPNMDIQIPVAIKLIKAGHCDTAYWNHYARQFMDEINMMARIKSNYVIRLYGGYITREEFVIVMELMEQGSLDGYIRRRVNQVKKLHAYHGGEHGSKILPGLPLIEVVKIMLQIAKGLSDLHPSVVHRDLKPQNILLDRQNRVKIGDLGLSKMKSATLMSVSEMKGTPAYIAPEVFMNNNISEKCDMYAFAVIFWECISGQKPWVHYQMPVQIMHDVIWKGKRPPLPPDCDESIKSIIEKCWDKEPLKRLSAYDVGTRLQRLLYQLDEKEATQLDLFTQATKQIIGSQRDLFSRTFFQPKPKMQKQTNQYMIQLASQRRKSQNNQNISNHYNLDENSQGENFLTQMRGLPRKVNERHSRINSGGMNKGNQQNGQIINQIPNPQQHGTVRVVQKQTGTQDVQNQYNNIIMQQQNTIITDVSQQSVIIPDIPQYNGRVAVVKNITYPIDRPRNLQSNVSAGGTAQYDNKKINDIFQDNDFNLNLNIFKGLGEQNYISQQQAQQFQQASEG